ncbi:stage 0 sporulation protein B (sporulation initiation phosphotransferase) [Fictibacillus solisalsi]|uniref:Stage 0 sporulation protein B (Sporulation initiation phosphotransferase) n=1 Tax=Fictibacillus solisalsi TaxID=459525 RepID=A0A1G9WRB3_9BACL|nr:Spo0B domain-containing protein [Fictibacillus solisalsi]SDM87164.1 stage 0 sporulation protein B (sporulation initiation phosphotransferase) [Fictibacillus solisalsi]
MSRDWSTLDVLRHARHDWLNQLQLIKANLSLGRTERASEIIEEIILSSRHESSLMNLKVPELAEYLITFNWLKHPIILETRVTGEARNLSYAESELLEACRFLFETISQAVSPLAENRLVFTISIQEDFSSFMYKLTGSIHNEEVIQEGFQHFQETHKLFDVIESYIHSDEVFLVLQLENAKN